MTQNIITSIFTVFFLYIYKKNQKQNEKHKGSYRRKILEHQASVEIFWFFLKNNSTYLPPCFRIELLDHKTWELPNSQQLLHSFHLQAYFPARFLYLQMNVRRIFDKNNFTITPRIWCKKKLRASWAQDLQEIWEHGA